MRRHSPADSDAWAEDKVVDEIHDLSPGAFRFVAAFLVGLGVLALAGAF